MSEYEVVCDLLRQRRAERRAMQEAGKKRYDDVEFLAVLQDALVELGPLFKHDVEECERLKSGHRGLAEQYARCLLLQQWDTDIPLQSEMDA